MDGTYDNEVPLDSAEDAMDALQNSHIPFRRGVDPNGYGGVVRRSAIISARLGKLTAEGAREHHDENT
jgi:hypothetical protein